MLAEEADESLGRRRWLAGCAACTGLAFLALAILARHAPFFPVDLVITRYVQSAQAGWITLLLRPLNVLGFPPLVGIIYGTIVLLMFAARARWEAVAAGFGAAGGAGLNFLVKALVDRPRPPAELVHVAHLLPGSSFPAGHVLNFTAFAGFLCYLMSVHLAPSWRRTALIAPLVAMMALMGIARIYAGEHWPSDVLGGYLVGILWLAATIELYRLGRRRKLDVHLGRGTEERRHP